MEFVKSKDYKVEKFDIVDAFFKDINKYVASASLNNICFLLQYF